MDDWTSIAPSDLTTATTTTIIRGEHEDDGADEDLLFFLVRNLQAMSSSEADDVGDPRRHTNDRGRTVLTILYLCVLGLCFITPVLYYCRLHSEERNARRLRELEAAGIVAAIEQSQQNREESRAVRRKYIEERRARILQLFAPVRMILREEHFPSLRGKEIDDKTGQQRRQDDSSAGPPVIAEEEAVVHNNSNSNNSRGSEEEEPLGEEADRQEVNSQRTATIAVDVESGVIVQSTAAVDPTATASSNDEKDDDDESTGYPYGEDDDDEEAVMVELPVPGLHNLNGPQGGPHAAQPERRLVPSLCTICLSNFKVGSDVVWSSNHLCEHVFHESCIEKWLMKQREGPLCPCCRRDFIVDPYDIMEEDNNNNNGSSNDEEDPNNTNRAGAAGAAADGDAATAPFAAAAVVDGNTAGAAAAVAPLEVDADVAGDTGGGSMFGTTPSGRGLAFVWSGSLQDVE